MTYNPNIPQPNDFLSESQNDILDNFRIADAAMNINHYPFSDGATNRGKHKHVAMVEQAAPAGNVGEESIWAQVVGAQGELFFKRGNSATNIRMTSGPSTGPDSNVNGFTFLPGGLLLQWGTAAVVLGVNNVNFPTPFTTCLNVQITPIRAVTTNVDAVYLFNFAPTLFQCVNTSNGGILNINWVAIGTG